MNKAAIWTISCATLSRSYTFSVAILPLFDFYNFLTIQWRDLYLQQPQIMKTFDACHELIHVHLTFWEVWLFTSYLRPHAELHFLKLFELPNHIRQKSVVVTLKFSCILQLKVDWFEILELRKCGYKYLILFTLLKIPYWRTHSERVLQFLKSVCHPLLLLKDLLKVEPLKGKAKELKFLWKLDLFHQRSDIIPTIFMITDEYSKIKTLQLQVL